MKAYQYSIDGGATWERGGPGGFTVLRKCSVIIRYLGDPVPARRATPSSECALPPLPEPAIAKGKGFNDVWAEHDYYTAEQVEQIRREAVEADRRARANSPEILDGSLGDESTQAAQGVPDGWKLVPLKPTDDMIVAFAEQWYSKVRCIDDCEMGDCYGAMLDAAPPLSSEPQAEKGSGE